MKTRKTLFTWWMTAVVFSLFSLWGTALRAESGTQVLSVTASGRTGNIGTDISSQATVVPSSYATGWNASNASGQNYPGLQIGTSKNAGYLTSPGINLSSYTSFKVTINARMYNNGTDGITITAGTVERNLTGFTTSGTDYTTGYTSQTADFSASEFTDLSSITIKIAATTDKRCLVKSIIVEGFGNSSDGGTCDKPSSVQVETVSATSVKLSWTAPGSPAAYKLQYKVATVEEWNTVDVTTNPYTLSGLTTGTTYAWQVASVCEGETTAYTAGENFTPEAAPATPEYRRVTNISEIDDNGRYIIVAKDKNVAMSSYNPSKTISYCSITIANNGTITSNYATSQETENGKGYPVEFSITAGSGSNEGKYIIKPLNITDLASHNLVGAPSGADLDYKTSTCAWSIMIGANYDTISAGSNRSVIYRESASGFKHYSYTNFTTTGYTPVQLYKKQGGNGGGNEDPVTPGEASITVAASKTYNVVDGAALTESIEFDTANLGGVITATITPNSDASKASDITVAIDETYTTATKVKVNLSIAAGLAAGSYEDTLVLAGGSDENTVTKKVVLKITATQKTFATIKDMLKDRTDADFTGNMEVAVAKAVVVHKDASHNRIWVQDTSVEAGGAILLYDVAAAQYATVNPKNVVKIKSGKLAKSNKGLIDITDPDIELLLEDDRDIFVKENVSLADLSAGNYQGQLVCVKNVHFTGNNATGNFAATQNYTITDATETELTLRTDFSDANYIGKAIPSGICHITGIVGHYNSGQITPRNEDDIVEPSFDLKKAFDFGKLQGKDSTAKIEIEGENLGGDVTVALAHQKRAGSFELDLTDAELTPDEGTVYTEVKVTYKHHTANCFDTAYLVISSVADGLKDSIKLCAETFVPDPTVIITKDTTIAALWAEGTVDVKFTVEGVDLTQDIEVEVKSTRNAFALKNTSDATVAQTDGMAEAEITVTYTYQSTPGKDTALVIAKHGEFADTAYAYAESKVCPVPVVGDDQLNIGQTSIVVTPAVVEGYTLFQYASSTESTDALAAITDFTTVTGSFTFTTTAGQTVYYKVRRVCVSDEETPANNVYSQWLDNQEVTAAGATDPEITFDGEIKVNNDNQDANFTVKFQVENFDFVEGGSKPHHGYIRTEFKKGNVIVLQDTINVLEHSHWFKSGTYTVYANLLGLDKMPLNFSSASTNAHTFTINLPDVADPAFTVLANGGAVSGQANTYYDSVKFEMGSTTEDAKVYYRVKPATEWTLYTAPILVKTPGKVEYEAIAAHEKMDTSAVISQAYTVKEHEQVLVVEDRIDFSVVAESGDAEDYINVMGEYLKQDVSATLIYTSRAGAFALTPATLTPAQVAAENGDSIKITFTAADAARKDTAIVEFVSGGLKDTTYVYAVTAKKPLVAEEADYEKVTDVAQITDGKYLIVATSKKVALSKLNINSTDKTREYAYSISLGDDEIGDEITVTAAVEKDLDQPYEITITSEGEGVYSLYDDAYELYLTHSSSGKNTLNPSSTKPADNWTITINAQGVTSIKTNSRILQYNTSSPRFACYTGSQTDVTLYKRLPKTPRIRFAKKTTIEGIVSGTKQAELPVTAKNLSEGKPLEATLVRNDRNAFAVTLADNKVTVVYTAQSAVGKDTAWVEIKNDGEVKDTAYFYAQTLPCVKPTAITATSVNVATANLTVTGADSVRYQYKIKTAEEWSAIASTTDNKIALSALTADTPYMVRVQRICAAGYYSEFDTVEFRTLSSTAKNVTLVHPTDGQVFTDTVAVEFTPSNFVMGTDGIAKLTFDANKVVYVLSGTTCKQLLQSGNHTVAIELVKMDSNQFEPAVTDGPVSFRVQLPKAVAPVFTPGNKTLAGDADSIFFDSVYVAMATTTEGAVIRYNTSGNTWRNYTEPIKLGIGTTTLKAYAKAPNSDNSDTTTLVYTVKNKPRENITPVGTIILAENFNKSTTASTTAVSNFNNVCDNEGWTGENLYPEVGMIKGGSAKKAGKLTSPMLNLNYNNGVYYVAFFASIWSGDANKIYLKAGDSTLTIEPLTTNMEEFVYVLDNGAENMRITFEATTENNNRFYLDSIRVYQDQPVMPVLTVAESVNFRYEAGETGSAKMVVKGSNLENNVAVAVKDGKAGFAATPATLDKAKVMTANGDTVTVTYSGSALRDTAEITLTCGELVKSVKAYVTKNVPTVGAVKFTPKAGAYNDSVWVKMSCDSARASIRYTTDGSEPNAASTLFADSIKVTTNTNFKARGFIDGYLDGPVASATYTIRHIAQETTAEGEIVFEENFSKVDGTNWSGSEITASLDDWFDNQGWTGTAVYKGPKGVKLGTGSVAGSITTPGIDLSNDNGKFYVAFLAGVWGSEAETMLVSVGDVTLEIGNMASLGQNDPASKLTQHVVMFENGTASTKITLASSATRIMLDSIRIYQKLPEEAMFVGVVNEVAMTYMKGESVSEEVTVKGKLLEADVTVAVTGEGFSVAPATLAKADVMGENGAKFTVTYNGASDTLARATVTLTSGTAVKTIAVTATAIPTYATLEDLYDLDIDETRVYIVTGDVVVTHKDSKNKRVWVQDANISANEGASMLLYNLGAQNQYDKVEVGDVISGLSGKYKYYHGLLEMASLTDTLKVTGHGHDIYISTLPLQELLEYAEYYQNALVKVEGLNFQATGNFSAGNAGTSPKNYVMTDELGDTLLFRTDFKDADYLNTAIPVKTVNLTGIITVYDNDVQITARNLADIEVEEGTAIESLRAFDVTVYPNPNTGRFYVNVAEKALVEVFNTAGVRVQAQQVSAKTELQLNAAGIYFIRVTAGEKSQVKRVVVR